MYVIVCLFLIVVVLLQQGRAGDIASAFGGSSSQTVFGARSGATILTRATTVAAVLFMVGSVALAILWEKGPFGGRRDQRAGHADSAGQAGVGAGSCPTAPAQPAPSQPAPAEKK